MYNECVSCPRLGVSCDGPNFVAMSAHDLLEWCKSRKHYLDLSNAELAEISRTPKGTIDRLFAGEHNDFKYETMRPLVRALVGGVIGENPCPDPNTDMEKTIAALREENVKLKEQIVEIETEYDEDADELKLEHREETRFLRNQITSKNIAIVVLSVLLGIALTTIIAFLAYDFMNPDAGFFWLNHK